MPAYTLVRSHATEAPVFAVVASDEEAHYVHRPNSNFMGMTDARIQRILKASKKTPTTELEWFRLACSNIGYLSPGEIVPAETLKDAIIAAKEALQSDYVIE